MPKKVDFEPYTPHDDLVKYRKELEQRYKLQSGKAGEEIDEISGEKSILTPENKVRKLLF